MFARNLFFLPLFALSACTAQGERSIETPMGNLALIDSSFDSELPIRFEVAATSNTLDSISDAAAELSNCTQPSSEPSDAFHIRITDVSIAELDENSVTLHVSWGNVSPFLYGIYPVLKTSLLDSQGSVGIQLSPGGELVSENQLYAMEGCEELTHLITVEIPADEDIVELELMTASLEAPDQWAESIYIVRN